MLTISKPLNSAQAQTYHKREFTAKEQSYWARGHEVQGEWQGGLAEKFGVSGPVTTEEFARLSQGQHPRTREQLVQHRTSHTYQNANGKMVTSCEHRAGWDATFSAPKSVSLTALVGGDSRIREAHRQSVRIALEQLERYTQARVGGDYRPETTGKFIVAKFEHDTARPVDGYAAPQLHTHAVIFNVTELDSGETRALQPHSLFASQQFATAVYQSELTYRLVRLGYELEQGRSGAPEIKGYTQEYLDASSPRSRQIKDHLQRLGLNSKESAEIAAHCTRDKKEILTPAEVLRAHRLLAAEFGNQAEQVIAQARERRQNVQQPALSASYTRAQEAVTFSRDKNFEREAVVDERLLMRDALRRGMGKTKYEQVHRNFQFRLQRGEFLIVPERKLDDARTFTTPDMVAAEREVIQQMRSGQGRVAPAMTERAALELTAAHPQLNLSQKIAIEQVLTSSDRIQGIQGVAGTGKTTALRLIRSAAETEGYYVKGLAPTSRAAKQLESAGVPTGTLQGFLVRRQSINPDERQKHLYFVDESSLTSTKQMRQFLNYLDPGDRVVLIGDIRQHQAIEAGKPFEQLQEAGMVTAKLDQILRQKNPHLLTIVECLARGEVQIGIEALREQGCVRKIIKSAERAAAIAKAFVENPNKTMVVSPDNASRRELNQAIRSELQARGKIGTKDHFFKILVQRDLTGADRQWAVRYTKGDFLRYSRGSRRLGIAPGNYARVVGVDRQQNLLTVATEDTRTTTYNPSRLVGVNIYQEVEQPFAAGDRIQFTAPNKALGVVNRELGTINGISAGGLVTARLESGRLIAFNPTVHRHFDHGYALTSHSAQGLTADRVLINIDTRVHPDLINSRLAYVAVSRARHDVQIYTNDDQSLAKQLANTLSKSSALQQNRGLDTTLLSEFGVHI